MEKEEEKCCGACCFMCYEDTEGWGQCVKQDIADSVHCSDLCTNDKYVRREEMRHHLAVLLQHKRWFHAPTGLMPIDFDGIEKAIDFAVDYIKTFNKL